MFGSGWQLALASSTFCPHGYQGVAEGVSSALPSFLPFHPPLHPEVNGTDHNGRVGRTLRDLRFRRKPFVLYTTKNRGLTFYVPTMNTIDTMQVSPHGSLSLLLLQSAGIDSNRERTGAESIGVAASK